jgi:hypothetical protein
MHASIAVCVMMVGGWLQPAMPDSEVPVLPLKEDLSRANYLQDLEWKERVKRKPLPRVPTIDDRTDDGLNSRRQMVTTTDPKTGQSRIMPLPPTSADRNQANQVLPNIPSSPTGGGAGGTAYPPIGPGGAGSGGYVPPVMPKNDPYQNIQIPGRSPVAGGYSQYNYTRGYPGTPTAQTVNNLTYQNSMDAYTRPYGLTGQSTVAGPNSNKPFSDYRAPSGSSPWNNLYLPSNNGTVNPYTNYVRPAMDQQNFNAHVSEQINGVPTLQRGYGAGAPGMEAPTTGGAGLINPQIMLQYR